MYGGITSSIGSTLTFSSAGPLGCPSHSSTAPSSSAALVTVLTPKPYGFRDFAKIRIDKIRIDRKQSFAFLLKLHESQFAVVVDRDFDR